MKTIQPARLLKLALGLDAAASVGLGLLQLTLPALLSEHLQLPTALLTGTGMFLVAYGAMLLVLANMRRIWEALVQFIVAGNLGWTLASLAMLMSDAIAPNGLGIAFVLAQAAAVVFFAWQQYSGLRESIWDSPGKQLQSA